MFVFRSMFAKLLLYFSEKSVTIKSDSSIYKNNIFPTDTEGGDFVWH